MSRQINVDTENPTLEDLGAYYAAQENIARSTPAFAVHQALTEATRAIANGTGSEDDALIVSLLTPLVKPVTP